MFWLVRAMIYTVFEWGSQRPKKHHPCVKVMAEGYFLESRRINRYEHTATRESESTGFAFAVVTQQELHCSFIYHLPPARLFFSAKQLYGEKCFLFRGLFLQMQVV